jgi:hypothetical protein
MLQPTGVVNELFLKLVRRRWRWNPKLRSNVHYDTDGTAPQGSRRLVFLN